MLADLHNAEELKNTSVRYVVDHSEDFVDQVGFTRNNFLFRTHFNPCFVQVDKFKSYPDLMALLFKAMAKSPPAKRRK